LEGAARQGEGIIIIMFDVKDASFMNSNFGGFIKLL